MIVHSTYEVFIYPFTHIGHATGSLNTHPARWNNSRQLLNHSIYAFTHIGHATGSMNTHPAKWDNAIQLKNHSIVPNHHCNTSIFFFIPDYSTLKEFLMVY